MSIQTMSRYMVSMAFIDGLEHILILVVKGVEMDFSHGYYYALLDLVDIFFDGSVDQNTLEECARYMFGTKGYMIFTIDKLVMLLVRHVSTCFILLHFQ